MDVEFSLLVGLDMGHSKEEGGIGQPQKQELWPEDICGGTLPELGCSIE